MSRLWITGYRSYELGIFTPNDPKIKVINYVLSQVITDAINDGVDWIISGGQLGVEQWALKEAVALKTTYPDEYQVALMTPFANFGSQWQAANQQSYQDLKLTVDFFGEVSSKEYQSPQQLKNYQDFMISHTDRAILIYDEDVDGKPGYDYRKIKSYAQDHPYDYQLITFDDLQEKANEYQESLNNSFQDE